MPIPKTRADLVELVTASYAKLRTELEVAGVRGGSLPAVDDWSAKDLLSVRLWWTEHVVDWIEAGRRGESPTTPAPGYQWNETPRLNADIVKTARRTSYRQICDRLQCGVERVLETIEALDDRELLSSGAFPWAGKWPLSRWISINTARQYTTARTYIRRARRDRDHRGM